MTSSLLSNVWQVQRLKTGSHSTMSICFVHFILFCLLSYHLLPYFLVHSRRHLEEGDLAAISCHFVSKTKKEVMYKHIGLDEMDSLLRYGMK